MHLYIRGGVYGGLGFAVYPGPGRSHPGSSAYDFDRRKPAMRQTASNDRLVSYFCYIVVDKPCGVWKGLIEILVLVKREDGIGTRNWWDMIIFPWRSAHEV